VIASQAVRGVVVVDATREESNWYFEWRGPTAAKATIRVDADTTFKIESRFQHSKESTIFVFDMKRDFTQWTLTDVRLKVLA
jgi:hypothetical protein